MAISTRSDLERLDQEDPLASFRDEFFLPKDVIYLNGNSLGAMPEAVRGDLQRYADLWDQRGVRAWNEEWWDLGAAVGAIREVYESDDRGTNRKLALAALQAIGDYRAVDYLARHVENAEADEGRALVASVLSEYYEAKASAPQ